MRLKSVFDSVPGRVAQKFLTDQAPNWAVLIAWNALFAMFPIVLVILGVLGLFLGTRQSGNLIGQLLVALPDPAAREQFLLAVNGVHTQTGLLFVVGFLGLLWGGSALFGAMDQVFAFIYHTRPRDFLPQKVMSMGMIVLFTILGGIAVATSAVLPALRHIPGLPSVLYQGAAVLVAQVIIGLVAGFVLYLTIFFVVPNRRQRLSQVWPGALLSGFLFEGITLLFPLYLFLNRGVNQYGKFFALFFVLLTFFFFIGLITMLGIELNSVLYPIPIAAPEVAAEASETATLPTKDAAGVRPSESFGRSARSTSPDQEVPRGVRRRTAVGLALIASVLGLIVGRRSAR